ncbi:MAG TPA: hypothetical protein DIT48_10110 [Actinobacteria bacterium]|nr:hypothetical protein [Actinomycetota bacterium]HCP60909.1 hypothetical protein [Actinomycetota bacterium]
MLRWWRPLAVPVALALVTGGVAGLVEGKEASSATRRERNPSLAPPNTHPNIVFILTDDQRWDSLWAMPNVRHLLGAHGITFNNMFVTTSLCCPSRASILTGLYSHHTGVYDNAPPNGGAPSFDDRSTVATWLHGAGYTTGLVGKYLNDYPLLGPTYIPPGWDGWNAIDTEPMTRYWDYTLNENGRLVHYGAGYPNYSTTVLANRALQFISEARAPYFLYFAPIAPHLPAWSAYRDRRRFGHLPDYYGRSFNEPNIRDKPYRYPQLTFGEQRTLQAVRRRQLDALQAVDRSVAAIYREVAARGQLGNTVFVFASDNGFLWGEHRLFDKEWPYEESIRVPLVIRAPWIQAPGRTDTHLVLNIDLAPTFASLAGIKPPIKEDGRSLTPLLGGRSPPWRRSFVVEWLAQQTQPKLPPPYEGIRTERYLWVEYRNGWRELYDLKNDSYELNNLASIAATAKLRHALHLQLQKLLRR